MIEENKYYTPEIEEFHVGFEFEINDGKKWKPDTLTVLDHDYPDLGELQWAEVLLKKENIRVKSFDAQDLSDLEWEVSLKGALNFRAEKELPFDRKATVWTKIDGKIQIDLKSPNEGKYRKEAAYFIETIFLGHIRNKSEFKRITKQLVI